MRQPKQAGKKPKPKKKTIHTICGRRWDDHHIKFVKGKPVWLCP